MRKVWKEFGRSLYHKELRSRSDEAFNLELIAWRQLLHIAGLTQSWEVKTNIALLVGLVCIVAWNKTPGTRNSGLSKSRSFSGSVKLGLGSSLPLHNFLS